jgi:hypothetical protein
MSKFQIEKVEHNYIAKDIHICCVVDYSPMLDELFQYNYSTEEYAINDKCSRSVGIWRIKSLKNKNN